MKRYTPTERRQLKAEGYTDEEILAMEMEEPGEQVLQQEGEMLTNAQNMRGINWNELKEAGVPDTKRAGNMNKKK
jgi:hypothetical protein